PQSHATPAARPAMKNAAGDDWGGDPVSTGGVAVQPSVMEDLEWWKANPVPAPRGSGVSARRRLAARTGDSSRLAAGWTFQPRDHQRAAPLPHAQWECRQAQPQW